MGDGVLGHAPANLHHQFVPPATVNPEELMAWGGVLPAGDTDWQLLRWDNTLGLWVLLDPPATGAAHDYENLQRATDDTLVWDQDRAHA